MPSIAETIRADMTAAMRARDAGRRDTLRLLIAALDNARIAAGREVVASGEQAELEIISAYLPEELSEDEIRTAIDEVVTEVGASGPGDLGKVMGPLMGRVRGRADGRRVNELVRERLASG